MAYRTCIIPQAVMDERDNRPLDIRVGYTHPTTGAPTPKGPKFFVIRGTVVKCSDAFALEALDSMQGGDEEPWAFFEELADDPLPAVDVDWDQLLIDHLA